MLDIGCCAKFGGGGGFAASISGQVSRRYKYLGKRSLHSEAIEGSGITIIPVRMRLNRKAVLTHFSVLSQWLSSTQGCHLFCWLLSRPQTSDAVVFELVGQL